MVLLGALGALASWGTSAAEYPSPLPDFAHPTTPHFNDVRFSPIGGNEDRPILVIYLRWDDVDYPADFDAATVARRFFGTGFPSTTFPSVGDYFRRLSFNRLFLFPAAETQGVDSDGVVQVHVPGTKAQFFMLSETARNRRALELADPYVDFSSFDTNGDGRLSDLELVVNVLEAEPNIPLPGGCGIARGVDPLTLDGTNLSGLLVAMDNTATNLITIIHENAHVALGIKDLYGFDVDQLDIGAATCNLSDITYFAPNAWHKMHWGWITPTVVTKDGFYEIRRADTTGDAFILYDPDRGTSDYFMVENRRITPGTYDQGAATGLVIWRVDDDAFGVDVPIGLVRPRPEFAAWNPAHPQTPQRTMVSPWLDGTPSNLAVRAIGSAGEVMRAYFDVRGPGILVDTYFLDRFDPVRFTAGGQNVLDVPVMNTGEACDTFIFEAADMPAGWTFLPGARILCAGEESFARLTIVPDANAEVGVHTISIVGRSQTNAEVVTPVPLSVEVVLRPTKLGLTGLLPVSPTGPVMTFQAQLMAEDDPTGVGLEGVLVIFTLSGPGGTLTAQATTNADGLAVATTTASLPPGSYTLTIETERLGAFAPTSTTVPYEVLSNEGSVAHVADQLSALISGATDARVRAVLQSALSELIGNNGGKASNGALDKLEHGDPVSSITKLAAALGHLLTAEARGAGDLSDEKLLLGLTAEAIAIQEYEAALDAVGTPTPREAATLAEIVADLELGHAQLQAGSYVEACKTFRRAASQAFSLAR